MRSSKDRTRFASKSWKAIRRSRVFLAIFACGAALGQQPEFVHGDECLFCHRNDIGPGWQKNVHGITIRQSEDALEWRDVFKGQATLSTIAPQVEYYMGSRHRLRFLKKEGYGKFALLNTQADLGN